MATTQEIATTARENPGAAPIGALRIQMRQRLKGLIYRLDRGTVSRPPASEAAARAALKWINGTAPLVQGRIEITLHHEAGWIASIAIKIGGQWVEAITLETETGRAIDEETGAAIVA